MKPSALVKVSEYGSEHEKLCPVCGARAGEQFGVEHRQLVHRERQEESFWFKLSLGLYLTLATVALNLIILVVFYGWSFQRVRQLLLSLLPG